MLWDLNEAKHLYSLEAGDVVNALVFSPNRYWLCAATASCIKIFDLESKWVELQSCDLAVMLMHAVSSGQLSMSSSQNVPTPARSRNRCACRSPGQRMARHCLVVSPTTLSVSGALYRNCFVGPVVYYMTCCTLKIDRCCIHVRFRSLGGQVAPGSGTKPGKVTRGCGGRPCESLALLLVLKGSIYPLYPGDYEHVLRMCICPSHRSLS